MLGLREAREGMVAALVGSGAWREEQEEEVAAELRRAVRARNSSDRQADGYS